ncbi:MAG: hypothetical protein HFF17_08360 [Oscillospiraceae bacterium]|nr:hypothetical protein [Oscillospiraceae bacterium]
MAERSSFEPLKRHICHQLRRLRDIGFILDTLDYISRINGVPLAGEYEDLRQCRPKTTLYPSGILAVCAAANSDAARADAVRNSIPAFIRFHILEGEVRDAI